MQFLSICYTERLTEASIKPSVGSVGYSHVSALAESVIRLYKEMSIWQRSHWRNLEAVELATLDWVAWLKNRRLAEGTSCVPPAGFEEAYDQIHESAMAA